MVTMVGINHDGRPVMVCVVLDEDLQLISKGTIAYQKLDDVTATHHYLLLSLADDSVDPRLEFLEAKLEDQEDEVKLTRIRLDRAQISALKNGAMAFIEGEKLGSPDLHSVTLLWGPSQKEAIAFLEECGGSIHPEVPGNGHAEES